MLSLDILAGVFCGYSFARVFLDCDCPPATPFLLCGTVWLIYTLDHLLDARILKDDSAKPAYRWHWQYRKILWPVLLAAGACLAIVSLVFLPGRILVFGCILGSIVILYTLVNQGKRRLHRKYLFREGWISLIYTAGVWGAPLLYHGSIPDLATQLAIMVYLLLVMINVLIYTYHEYRLDLAASQLTLATVTGRKTTRHLLRLLMLCVLTLILAAFLILDDAGQPNAYYLLLGMAGGLGLILSFPRFFSKHARYGILADGLFLLPGLLLWTG